MAKKESKKARKKRLQEEAKSPLTAQSQSSIPKTTKLPTPKFELAKLWPLGIILLISFLCFYPSLDCEFVNWDDDKNFYENPLITELNSDNF